MALSRRELILKYIVEYFMKTAQPVGSNTLIEEYHMPYSSATIRNEMAALENEGMIEKTHTSSGRVPSTKGYKYYISNLRDRDVDEEIKHRLALVLNEKSKSIEDVIRESCEILSHMTNLASVVLGPNAEDEHLVSIQMVPITGNTATAIFITDKGYVENKTFVFNEEVCVKDLQDCVKILNDRLVGTPISQVLPKMEVIKPIITSYVKNNDIIYRTFAEMLMKITKSRVSTFGTENLLEQPEFASDAQAIRKMIRILDSDELMDGITHSHGREVFMDEDFENSSFNNISVVSTDINVNGQKRGRIALVGPKRMEYDRVIAALEYFVEELNNFMNVDRKEDEDGR